MDVSVVIPTYGEDKLTVAHASESAFKASASDVVRVRDDETINLLSRDYNSPLTHDGETSLQFVESIHAGVCHARNLGIFYAKNSLIVPLDADDELLPGGLQYLVEAWEPGTLVYGGWIERKPVNTTSPDIIWDEKKVLAAPPEMLSRKNVAHATWLFHKDDWARVGGYDPDFNIGGEDWALMCALVEAGVKPKRINHMIFKRTIGLNRISRTDLARSRIDFIKQLLREKYPTVMNAGR